MVYIHPTAVVAPNVKIGDGTYIGPFCIIGDPAEHRGKWLDHSDWNGDGVIIGENCVITGLVTIDAGTERPTELMPGCFVMKHAHIGHDCIIGPNVTIACGAKIGGHAVIGEGSNIGLNAVIHQRQVIKEGCMIGMGSVITKKTETFPYRKYAGNPARDIGENIKK